MKLFCIFISTMAFGGMLLTSCGEKKETKARDGGGVKEQAAGGSEEKEQAAGVGDKANEGMEGKRRR